MARPQPRPTGAAMNEKYKQQRKAGGLKKKKKLSDRQKQILLTNYHSSSEDEASGAQPAIQPKKNLQHLVRKRNQPAGKLAAPLVNPGKVLDLEKQPTKRPAKSGGQSTLKQSNGVPAKPTASKQKPSQKLSAKPSPKPSQKRPRSDDEEEDSEGDEESSSDEEFDENGGDEEEAVADEAFAGDEADYRPEAEDSDDEADEVDLTEEVHSTFENPGWADVLAKLLAKNPRLEANKKTVVLAKAKRDYELVEQEPAGRRSQQQRQAWENLCRVRPDHNQKERERRLAMIASRGVVQLFNTIRQQKLDRRSSK